MVSDIQSESRGAGLEHFIADLASMFFLKDFVFLQPSYITGARKREVTDLMFLLNNDAAMVSVKGTDGNEKSATRLPRWAAKKAQEASKNAKTACQRAGRLEITATNLWGETRTFPAGTLKPIFGLGLVECSQEVFQPIQFELTRQVEGTASCPIHYLSANDFLNVAQWLGSIWDVFNYFKSRQQVKARMNGINLERPLLCYYTLRSHDDFSGFANEDRQKLSELHQLFLLETLPKYAERDKQAGFVNAVIHQLHERDQNIESYIPEELKYAIEPRDKRRSYLGMAALLNSLPMSNKAWIGQRIETCIQQVRATGQSTCFMYRQLRGNVAFVFAVFRNFNRTEKIRALNMLLPAAQYSSGLDEAFAVAYDADDEDIGFDVLWRRGPVQVDDEVKQLAARFFSGPTETICPTPFGEPRPYTPKSEGDGNTTTRL